MHFKSVWVVRRCDMAADREKKKKKNFWWDTVQMTCHGNWWVRHKSGKTCAEICFSADICTSSTSSVSEHTSERTHVTWLCVRQKVNALKCNLTNILCKCISVIWLIVALRKRRLVHFLNAYQCNLSICMLSQNAEWVQIAVMKLFHYRDEQCWINRNNKAECFIEPSVEVLWQRMLLCLQLWWLAGGQTWLLTKSNNSNLQLPVIYKQS